MKSIILSITVIISAFFIQVESFAQTRMVSGGAFTFDTIPLINATIQVKSSKQEVKTDENGRFEVECTSNDQLTISANGFSSEKIKTDTQSGNLRVNLKLKSGDKNRDAAIESGHISDVENFKAIVSKNSDDEDYSHYANIYEIIQGTFAGVQISNGDIIIRGFNTMETGQGSTDNSALIVVDGVINDKSVLSTLPTSLVKSIKVMKDGSATIYGSRGTNGVVLIETKK